MAGVFDIDLESDDLSDAEVGDLRTLFVVVKLGKPN